MVEVGLFAKRDYRVQVARRDFLSVVLVALVVLFLLDLVALPCVRAYGCRDPDTGRIKVHQDLAKPHLQKQPSTCRQ